MLCYFTVSVYTNKNNSSLLFHWKFVSAQIIVNNYWMRFFYIQNNQGRVRGYQPLLRPWLFWLSKKPNLKICFIIHWIRRKNGHDSKWNWWFISKLVKIYKSPSNTKHANLTWLPIEIMHCSHIWHDYPWPWASLT